MTYIKYVLLNIVIILSNVNGKVQQQFWEINQNRGECTINVNGDLGDPQPLLIIPYTDKFLLPQGSDGIVHMLPGENVELFCTKSFKNEFIATNIIVTCTQNGLFDFDGKEYAFKEFSCNAYPYHTARKTGELCNHGKACKFEIGFNVNDRFLRLMDVCHDEIIENTLYVHYNQTPANKKFQISVSRLNFITGGFYQGKNVDKLYKKTNQIAVFTKLLQSESLAKKLIRNKGDMYLSRGHLAAKADYIYGAQQKGTFYFLNVAPQFQKINAGNWEIIESGLRKFVAKRNINIEIYTGLYGIMSHPDINGNLCELFLYIDKNNNGLIPVPRLYYKIAIETKTMKGIALITINNPHINLDEIENSYIICNDISDKIDWLNWDRTNIVKGYSYACDVNDLAKAVGHLPELHVTGLLL